MKVGFDLDGIFIDGPPLIPRNILEWLYRGPQTNGPSYRFPNNKFEQLIRQISHFYFFRPKLQKNVNFLYQLTQDQHSHKFHLVSSRYQFLEKITSKLLQKYNLITPFSAINLNLKNEQPHLFKTKVINQLKIDLFVDDDLELLHYLKSHCPNTTLLWYNPRSKTHTNDGILTIKDLTGIKRFLK